MLKNDLQPIVNGLKDEAQSAFGLYIRSPGIGL